MAERSRSALFRTAEAAERFFFAPQPLHGLVAARVLLGGSLFLTYLRRLPHVQELWGPAGFGGAEFHARLPNAPPLNPNVFEALTLLRHVTWEAAIAALGALLVVASLAFTVGAFTRWSGALMLGLHLLFWARNPFVYEGSWAGFIVAPLLYTLLAPSGRHFSVDAWRREPGVPAPSWLATGWPLRLVQIHVCCMYVAAGWSRLDKESWLHGELVFVALSGATHSRLVIDWLPYQPLLVPLTYAALALEVLAPFALWLPRIGKLWALGLVALHLSLEVLTNVGWWSFVMIGGVLCFLLPLSGPAAVPRREAARASADAG